MRTTMAIAYAATAVLALYAPQSTGHGGGLDANGCHTNRKTGDYHCHRAQRAVAPEGIVKKSRSGICHGENSPYYEQTLHYVAFGSLQACLASGGRLPK